MADIDELARHFAASGSDHRNRSPFNAGLCRRIATEPDIVELLTAAPDEQQLPVLLLAAVHSIVLADPDIELAQWYPTASEQPLRSDPFPAFARLCADRADEIRSIVATHSVQTNEVGRCALLLPGLSAISQEVGQLSVIDVGTSAGLNLLLDHYEYHYEPGVHLGSPSPVRLRCSTRGEPRLPRSMPTIARRVGIDRSPIDVTDHDAARWLTACVWPDQADRFERLRAAIGLVETHPPEIRTGHALDLLPDVVRSTNADGHPVVLNSWVLNYLTTGERHRYVDQLDTLGAELDLSWVYAEAPALCPGIPFPAHLGDEHITVMMVIRWRSGRRASQLLGTAHPHGYWWQAPMLGAPGGGTPG